jgi:hypothetical protein
MLANSRVLMRDGRYRCVSKVKIGDEVLNLHGNVAQVKNIFQKESKKTDALVTITHTAWYNPVTVLGSTHVLMFDGYAKKVDFVETQNIVNSSKDCIVLPSTKVFDQKSDNQSPNKYNYELGFVIGAYLRCGSLRSFPEVSFEFDKNSDMRNIIDQYIKLVYNTVSIERYSSYKIQTSYFNKYLWNHVAPLGPYNHRSVPDFVYQYNDEEFYTGLNVGLVKAGRFGTPKLTPELYELLYWTAMNSQKPLCYNQFTHNIEKNQYDFCYSHVLMMDRGIIPYYELELQDSEHYIANNMVYLCA